MEKIIYITLSLLGINNEILINIIKSVPKNELKHLLSEKYLDIQFKYNINLSKYHDLLSDKNIIKEKLANAKDILEKNKQLGIKTILINSILYPYNLKNMDNPPAILYLRGKNITREDIKSVACVGTRNPTEFGIRACESIVGSLTRENFTIISGLAYGIDKLSHQSCLKNNGRTIAVLAHGLDIIYPKENEALSEEILKNNGTLVSEYPVGTRADKFRFVARNRIVSGLSKGVIVFETKIKSGTMHTVEYALKQKKKIFCPIPIREKEQTLGLIKLLEEKKAIGIKTKDNYDIVVKALDYKIKNDKNKIIQNKNESIKEIYNLSDNLSLNSIQQILEMNYNGRSGVSINKEIYTEFKKILTDNDISLKEFFNAVILNVVKKYKGGE